MPNILEVAYGHAIFWLEMHPLFIIGLGITGCSIAILLLFSIPWNIFKKNDITLLHDKLDILIREYKIEVTRAIEDNKIKQI